MVDEQLKFVRGLLPRTRGELLQFLLAAGAACMTIATALAPLRGVTPGALALLGVTDGLLALAAAVVGALRREAPLGNGLVLVRPGTHTLPASPDQFIGRRLRIARALRQLRRREHGAPVLAISGMPGVGKTALALVIAGQLARTSYPDNQLFIHVSDGLPRARRLMAALFEALVQLKVPAADIPADRRGRRNLYREALNGTRSLVVLDDASDDQLVDDLRPPDGCAAIVTCRVELVEGVRPMRLRPLSTLQALRFLVNRIGRWRVARQPVSALRLVAAYGRLPLALAYVSARLAVESGRHLPLRAVVRRLPNRRLRLEFASVGAHKSVALALYVSYQALIEEQQRAFCVFGLLDLPELDEEVVAAVLQDDPERVRKLLAQVVAVGLLEVAGRSGDRWRAHELARLFAAVMVSEWPKQKRQQAIRRAVEVYLKRIHTLRQLLASPVVHLDPEAAAAKRAELEEELAQQQQFVLALVAQAARLGMDLTSSLAKELVALLLGILTVWPDPAGGTDTDDPERRPRLRPGRLPDGPLAPPDAGLLRPPDPAGGGSPDQPRTLGPVERSAAPSGWDRGNGRPSGRAQQPSTPESIPTQSSPPPTAPPSPPPTEPPSPPPSRPPPPPTGPSPSGARPAGPPPPDGPAGPGDEPWEPPGDAGSATPPPPGGPDPKGSGPSAAGPAAELEALVGVLGGERGAGSGGPAVALISGPAGVGRWTLALQLARELATTYPDGRFVVDLSAMAGETPSIQDALASLLQAQGHSAKAIAEMPSAERQRRYRVWFEEKRALVLIRNATDAAQVRALLPVSPTSAVVVTSRSELSGLVPTVHSHLGPLSEAAAVELLARASRRDDIARDRASVWLVRWFGFHPLLLRCVGAWMGDPARRDVPVADLAGALIDRGPAVQLGMDSELVRRLRRCHQLVPPGTARMFRLLALLDAVDVDVEVAAVLAKVPPNAARVTLARLAEVGLLERPDPRLERFRLHPLLRRLAASQHRIPLPPMAGRAALARVFEHYVSHLDPPGGARWFGGNQQNLVATVFQASRVGLDAHAFALASSMARYCATGGYLTAWRRTAEVGLAAARRLHDPAALGRAYVNLADALLAADQVDDALVMYEGARARLPDGDRPTLLEARVATGLARVCHHKGDHKHAIQHYRHSLQLHRFLRPPHGAKPAVRLLRELGDAHVAHHQFEHAAGAYRQSADLARELGDLEAAEPALRACLDALDQAPGPPDRERQERKLQLLDTLARIQQRLGDQPRAAATLRRLGEADGDLGHPREGAEALGKSAKIFRQLSDLPQAASALEASARLERHYDQASAAERLRTAFWLYRELDDRIGQARSSLDLGQCYLEADRPKAAATAFRIANRLFGDLLEPGSQAQALWGLAAAGERLGSDLQAAQRFNTSAMLFQRAGQSEAAAAALFASGRLFRRVGQPEAAVAALRASARLAEQVGKLTPEIELALAGAQVDLASSRRDQAAEAAARLRLGSAQVRFGQQAEAATSFHRAALVLSHLGDDQGAATTYAKAAGLYRGLGRHDEAVADFKAAADHARVAKDVDTLVQSLASASSILKATGQQPEAAEVDRQLYEVAPPVRPSQPPVVRPHSPTRPPSDMRPTRWHPEGPAGGIAPRI